MKILGSIVVCKSGIHSRIKVADVYGFAIVLNRCSPTIGVFVKRDAFVARRIVDLCSSVANVLGICASTQIVTLIVEAIAVDVIALFAITQAENLAVHKNNASVSALPGCVPSGIKGLADLARAGIPPKPN